MCKDGYCLSDNALRLLETRTFTYMYLRQRLSIHSAILKITITIFHNKVYITVFMLINSFVAINAYRGGEPTSYHVILMIGSTCYFRKSCATLFDISVNTGQICMKFEADTPQKL